jgi:L-alanine-DL-glutamate epimerase-like enolase superfamily enzyme
VGRQIEELDIEWFEEPVPPETHDCHRLADGSPDRLAKPDVLTDAKAELEFDRRKACIAIPVASG